MRLTHAQTDAIAAVIRSVRRLMPPDEPATAAWIDVEIVEAADISLLSVRWPGRILRAGDPDEGEPAYTVATGVFVALVDGSGDVVHMKHTAAGTLTLDSLGILVVAVPRGS